MHSVVQSHTVSVHVQVKENDVTCPVGDSEQVKIMCTDLPDVNDRIVDRGNRFRTLA